MEVGHLASDGREIEAVGRYPATAMTPRDYEGAVARLFSSLPPVVSNLRVQHGDPISTPDGDYAIDTTVRYELFGAEYLTLVEAKLRSRPIERRFVQELYQKVLSAGAQKGILVASTRFQRGAVQFARVHGIALVQFIDGRLTWETKALDDRRDLSGPAPWFAGYAVEATEGQGVRFTAVSLNVDYARELFPGFTTEAT
jgi:hypothetical protein